MVKNMFVSIYTTVPDMETAKKMAKVLLEERLVACANIIPNVHSLYWWEGKIEEDTELIVLLKTRESLVHIIMEKIKRLHPYDVPAILVFKIEKGLNAYFEWIKTETLPPDKFPS